MEGHLFFANHPLIWGAAALGVTVVLAQSGFIIKKSIVAGKELGIPDEDIRKAIKTSAVGSIGPALGIVGTLLALLATMGSPVSTMRLSMIGSSAFEAMAADLGAKAMGSGLSPIMDPVVFTNGVWTMALGSMGWIIFVYLFAHKMDKINGTLTKGKAHMLPALGLGAMLGSFAYQVVLSFMKVTTVPKVTIAAVMGMALMFICVKLGAKHAWLKEWALTIAMLGGAVVATYLF